LLRKNAAFVLALLVGLLLAACLGQSSQSTSSPTPAPVMTSAARPTSPEEAGVAGLVFDFLVAVSTGNEPKARSYLTPEYNQATANLARALGSQWPPARVEVGESTVTGDAATVAARLHYPDRMRRVAIYLRRRDGAWRIAAIGPA
jgi:hypothetical protein